MYNGAKNSLGIFHTLSVNYTFLKYYILKIYTKLNLEKKKCCSKALEAVNVFPLLKSKLNSLSHGPQSSTSIYK